MPTRSASKTVTRTRDWLGPAVLPGEMLLEEFLKPLGLRQAEAAERLGISANRLNEVALGKRRITADTALRLSRMLNTSPHSSGCGCRRTGTCTACSAGVAPRNGSPCGTAWAAWANAAKIENACHAGTGTMRTTLSHSSRRR